MAEDKTFIVIEARPLLEFLLEQFPKKGRNKVKAMLTRRQVSVDDLVATRHDHPLEAGQRVVVRDAAGAAGDLLHGVRILFEDSDLIVIDKPAGLLSIASEGEKERTAYRVLTDYVRRSDSRQRIFVVHRLDRETSGAMMFAKREAVQQALQNRWKDAVTERSYLAVVQGRLSQPEGTITSWLKESKTLTMMSSGRPGDGLKAVTHYRVLRAESEFSLLEVRLDTGRKNQIRVHMQSLGHSVVGDRRYGSTKDPLGRLGLHARVLSFRHPITDEILRFETEIPPSFRRLFPG